MTMSVEFFTDFQSKLYNEYGYTMDKLNPTMNYWCYHTLSQERVYREIRYHNYHFHYADKLNDRRKEVKKVLEIGVFRGHSMLMWKDYFPNAQIYGIDIDYSQHHFGVNAKELCEDEERITLFEMDACNPINVKLLMRSIGNDFDVIIDDGSHHPIHQLFSLLYYTDYLKDDGIFVVEDVFLSKLFDRSFLDYFNQPFNLFTKEKFFFDEILNKGKINLSDYGLSDNSKEQKLQNIIKNWNIDIREPKPYIMTLQDIDLQGNSKQQRINNRQGIVFFNKPNQ